MKMYIRATVTDTKTGKIVKRTHWKKSRSFVLQFLKLLNVHMEHTYGNNHSGPTITDTGNTARTITINTTSAGNFLACDALEGDGTYGIVVGTDNTAETNTDYALATQIADGSGAGQLDHSAHTWIDAAEVGANVDMYVQRPFINNSGGAIVIEECGIYIKEYNSWIFCIVRDTTGGVTVNDGQTCTVEYLFRTAV